VKSYLDFLAPTRPEAAKANANEFVDLSFVQEIQGSGLIKQLYGRKTMLLAAAFDQLLKNLFIG
jgi:hypothetical protein